MGGAFAPVLSAVYVISDVYRQEGENPEFFPRNKEYSTVPCSLIGVSVESTGIPIREQSLNIVEGHIEWCLPGDTKQTDKRHSAIPTPH